MTLHRKMSLNFIPNIVMMMMMMMLMMMTTTIDFTYSNSKVLHLTGEQEKEITQIISVLSVIPVNSIYSTMLWKAISLSLSACDPEELMSSVYQYLPLQFSGRHREQRKFERCRRRQRLQLKNFSLLWGRRRGRCYSSLFVRWYQKLYRQQLNTHARGARNTVWRGRIGTSGTWVNSLCLFRIQCSYA